MCIRDRGTGAGGRVVRCVFFSTNNPLFPPYRRVVAPKEHHAEIGGRGLIRARVFAHSKIIHVSYLLIPAFGIRIEHARPILMFVSADCQSSMQCTGCVRASVNQRRQRCNLTGRVVLIDR